MSIGRERLTQEESRSVALEAARTLLIEDGPQAVTLKAVAARIGKTHANLLHHFGSAAGLQSELARMISDRVTGEIARVVERERKGEADPREIVDRTFDAFDKEGAGALAAWMILSGDRESLNPVLEAIHKLVDQIGTGHEDRPVHDPHAWSGADGARRFAARRADGRRARPAARPRARDCDSASDAEAFRLKPRGLALPRRAP